ncbi:MAG TPA: protein translocase subunit SecDF [Flavobacteriaceae bacterium]|nr:protein translocase subunit SecDF [Flavobacteriaceae bacterium]HEX5743670.1 protein translocase subunit SecDF [Flavobacteriaceae bacterium]
MQNKGLIKAFAILFGIVSLYQLSFTWFTKNVEEKASVYAQAHLKNNDVREKSTLEKIYLDSVANEPVIDLGFAQFSYDDIKNKEINLGLDLKGGINAILQVSVKDILIGLSNNSKNPVFNKALAAASEAQKKSDETYLNLFFQEFDKLSNGTVKLSDPSIFGNKSLRDKINFKLTNEEVKPIIADEVSGSISTAFEVLRSRIDKFGVTQPNIQRIGNSGRILIELPGAKDIERVKKLLQSTAELQFWEVYSNQETANFLIQADGLLTELLKNETETAASSKSSELDALLGDVKDSIAKTPSTTNKLFAVLSPNIPQDANQLSSLIATSSAKDTATVNRYLSMPEVRALLSDEMRYAKFLWDAKAQKGTDVISLYAIKGNRENIAPLEGDVIEDASQQYDQLGANPEVSMTMNSRGSKIWGKMTTENVGKFVAVVLDDQVYTAPRVNDAITTGRTSISGNFTVDEAQDLANVLKAGKLPAAAHIIQSEIVGPSLGQESIDSGLSSFLIAFILVLTWMLFYYGRAGWYADIALAVNLLFIMGILTAFGVVLTLPGIAGIVLTIGMAVDANVIIFERIKEEKEKGKATKEAIKDGFQNALSSIIDGNVTTLLTGIILYVFGTGPVKGFAYTLIIGILTSLFTAIFITRLLIEAYSAKGKSLKFSTKFTKKWFANIHVEFVKKRKYAYILSSTVIIAGLISLYVNGLNYGVDFVGGRSYTVRFENAVKPAEVSNLLKNAFGSSPEVKTYGDDNQLKITTKYKIDIEGSEIDDEVMNLLYTNLKSTLPANMTLEQFKGGYDGQTIGIMNAIKVEPTMATDIKIAAQWSIFGSLIVIFIYILLRFKKWQYSLGAVIASFHDALIVISVFSLFYKYLPFNTEIDQSFIAAILTIIGYSLNDTVVIFDRVREYVGEHKNWKYARIINEALSSTLSRTINTAFTTLIVLFAIFIFGGDSLKGFMFALIVGILVGTYSSLYVATPILYDTINFVKKGKVEKE